MSLRFIVFVVAAIVVGLMVWERAVNEKLDEEARQRYIQTHS
jgi:hypothetical protein